ncbi:hypothetical protein Acr_00g0034000 [Actinidia rufa]|uniref:Retrotransposon gag domain-containing protein n=1 Tax=Actinidia rufa TaxID=165716 RepID=A0A7J0DG12_9ERIC|nr:hypothetical protein Acr_00g0034000 [Actinidia rufa]
MEPLEQKVEDLRVIVEQLAVSVQQLQRELPRADGNRAGLFQPNQLVLERPPNYHRYEPRDPIINVEAPTFDGRLDPKAFTDWIREMDHFFEWHNLFDDRKAYTFVQNYEMVNKPSFGRCFENRNTPRLPVALPQFGPTPTTAPLPNDSKEKGILTESPGMKSTFQCYKCQGFGHKAANCGNRTLFVDSQNQNHERDDVKSNFMRMRTSNETRPVVETWDILKKELKDQFRPCNSSWVARESLQGLRHTILVRDYVKEFSFLLLDIRDMSEEDKLFNFMVGLQNWAQLELRRLGLKDLSSAIVLRMVYLTTSWVIPRLQSSRRTSLKGKMEKTMVRNSNQRRLTHRQLEEIVSEDTCPKGLRAVADKCMWQAGVKDRFFP